jgi:hypothetical protein
MLGSHGIMPADVLGSGPGGVDVNASVYGGSPHLRGVEAVTWAAAAPHSEMGATTDVAPTSQYTINITSLDVPIVCTGVATPFPTPRTGPPDMTKGVHFNIHQNIWNTNYVLFYPFDSADANIRSRFQLEFHAVVPF